MLQNKTTHTCQWLTSTKNYFQFTIHFHGRSTVALCHRHFIPGPRLMKENLSGILPVLRQWWGGEYTGNVQGLLTVLLRHGTHEFLLYGIGQSKSRVLV